MNNIKPAAFLLIKTNTNSSQVLEEINKSNLVVWSSAVYGPHQLVVYLNSEQEEEITEYVEGLREMKGITEIDCRVVKIIPKDEELSSFETSKKEVAVLLIGVNYKEEKERVVTWNLRDIPGIKLARAMWGPTDIVAIVEADDKESMRDKICDDVKTLKGVSTNSTYYCYKK
jgi:DNA-binding Lrp family transcriptional regulator